MESQPPDPLKEELTRYIANHLYRITDNLKRVGDLIKLAQNAGLAQRTKEDVLRSAVVFLHATLEDFLRYVGFKYLPTASEAVLDKISLVGNSDVLRAEKFFLGKLARHRGKTVDGLIAESVNSYLDKISFSEPGDISRLLECCDIRLEHVRQFYPAIGELMIRRHQIVHRADFSESAIEGPRDTVSIEAAVVTKWNETVTHFISAVIAEKLGQEFGPRLAEAKRQTSSQATQPTADRLTQS
jgi:hypothetical protein